MASVLFACASDEITNSGCGIRLPRRELVENFGKVVGKSSFCSNSLNKCLLMNDWSAGPLSDAEEDSLSEQLSDPELLLLQPELPKSSGLLVSSEKASSE